MKETSDWVVLTKPLSVGCTLPDFCRVTGGESSTLGVSPARQNRTFAGVPVSDINWLLCRMFPLPFPLDTGTKEGGCGRVSVSQKTSRVTVMRKFEWVIRGEFPGGSEHPCLSKELYLSSQHLLTPLSRTSILSEWEIGVPWPLRFRWGKGLKKAPTPITVPWFLTEVLSRTTTHRRVCRSLVRPPKLNPTPLPLSETYKKVELRLSLFRQSPRKVLGTVGKFLFQKRLKRNQVETVPQ